MKKLICILIYLFTMIYSTPAAEADGEIRLVGRVLTEGTNEDIPYVTVTVQENNSQVIIRQASDAFGRFTIQLKKAGSYQLILSAVGYTTTTHAVTIEEGKVVIDLGNIVMKEGVELSEVSIIAQKPLVKSDPDKLIYSVEADPEAQSNTLEEMLRKVPLLSVDSEGNVMLNGQSNFKVLVNGKSSSLMSNSFKEVVKNMPASSIKDIEVITNPSSKYEAEGVGGIINIITIRKIMNGYSGSVGVNGDTRGGFGANAYIAASISKFSFSTNIYSGDLRQSTTESYASRTDYEKTGNEYELKQHLASRGKKKVRRNGSSLNLEASYEIDTMNLISASAWGYLGSYNPISDMTSEVRNQVNEPIYRFLNSSNPEYRYTSLSGSVDYQHSFSKKDEILTVSYKIDWNPERSTVENSIEGMLNYPSYQQKSDNHSSSQVHMFQLDYFNPISEMHQLETGIKGIYRLNYSETDRFMFEKGDEDWMKDSIRNDLDYKQYIMGVYAGYLFKLKKTTFKIGLRTEYTWNDGVFKSKENTYFNNNFFNFIPYLNLTYTLKPEQTIKASYTQRLNRPGIWSLNPYINDLDPLNISYGNPKLDAEISHSFSFSYGQFSPRFNFNIELNSYLTDNSTQRYSFVENNIRYTTYKNMGSTQRHGFSLYASYRPNSKFSINLNGRMNYSILDARISDDIRVRNQGFVYGGNLNIRLETWKDGAVSVNSGGNSRWIILQGKANGYYYSSVGVTQKILKDKMDVAIFFSDPFSYKIYYVSDYYKDPSYSSHARDYRLGQAIRLSLTYRFGKINTQVKKAHRGIQSDDQHEGGGQAE